MFKNILKMMGLVGFGWILLGLWLVLSGFHDFYAISVRDALTQCATVRFARHASTVASTLIDP